MIDTARFAWLAWAALVGCLGTLTIIIVLTEWQSRRVQQRDEERRKHAPSTQDPPRFFIVIGGQKVPFGPKDPTPEELEFLKDLAEMAIDPRITRIH